MIVWMSDLQPKNQSVANSMLDYICPSDILGIKPFVFIFFLKISLTSHLLQSLPLLKDTVQIHQHVTQVPSQSDPKLFHTTQSHTQ